MIELGYLWDQAMYMHGRRRCNDLMWLDEVRRTDGGQ
jgi:hypothetical protein